MQATFEAAHRPDEIELQDPPGLGRIMIMGCAIGAVLSFALIFGGMLAFHQQWQSAFGLGLFIAFWGGLGFGSMVSGVVYLTRVERQDLEKMEHL